MKKLFDKITGHHETKPEEATKDLTCAVATEERKVVEKPPIVTQVEHRHEVEVVQPVIHREREQTEVHQVVENIYEKDVKPKVVHERSLEPEVKVPIGRLDEKRLYEVPLPAGVSAGHKTTPVEHETFIKEPIVVEVAVKKHVDVVQPVVHRDVYEEDVTYTTKPIFEKVIEKPVVVHEDVNVLPVVEVMPACAVAAPVAAEVVVAPAVVCPPGTVKTGEKK